jgi:hypothetical protein
MAGRGPIPKATRRNQADVPIRGEWQATPGIGWQHGPVPNMPGGITAAAKVAWKTWFRAWFASHWTPDDIPALRQIVRLYDQVERGEFHRAAELRLQMDTYGITPKGQQDRRWAPPKPEDLPEVTPEAGDEGMSFLRVVS